MTNLNNIAIALVKLGRPEEAMKLFTKCAKIAKNILGERHPNYLSVYATILGTAMYFGKY